MFRVLSVVALRRVYPRGHAGKRLVLLGAVLRCARGRLRGRRRREHDHAVELSGQRVEGDGFTFQAPKDWTAKVTATSAAASRRRGHAGLGDRAAAAQALQACALPAGGRRARPRREGRSRRSSAASSPPSRSIEAGGGRAREYEIAHGELVDRITFVLRAKREYELVCRWRKADGEPAACDQLVGSFSFR